MPQVGIVIVSYNTCELLRQALLSTTKTTKPAMVVVVDNASHDGSASMVRCEFSAVTLLVNPANRGFAAATNQGIAIAQEMGVPYILLLNPDARLLPGALEAMVSFMEAHPRVGCVGARLQYPDGRFQEGAWRFPTLMMTILDLFPPRGPLLGRLASSPLNGRYPAERGAEPFPIDHPLGAAMLLRRSTLDMVGLLDEDYWMFVEEVDWCRRAKAAGWAIWQVPEAQVVHVGGASTRQFRGRSLVALHRSRLRYFAKFESARYVALQRLAIRLGMVWATLRTFLAWTRGVTDHDELRSRLAAYGSIGRL